MRNSSDFLRGVPTPSHRLQVLAWEAGLQLAEGQLALCAIDSER